MPVTIDKMSFTRGKLFQARRNVFRGYALVMVLILLAILILPFFAPNDPYKAQFLYRLKPPSWDYPLGTDALGRCVLSRLMYGARLTTASALIVVVSASLIGSAIGAFAGMVGGILDRMIMRFCEGMSVFSGPGHLHDHCWHLGSWFAGSDHCVDHGALGPIMPGLSATP